MDTQTSAYRHVKPVRRRRWLIWGVLVTLILTSLAWVAYQQRIALLINAANAALQPYGFHVAELDGLQLSATSLGIRHLELLHSDSGAPQTLQDVHVDFTANGLISGRVDTISINAVELTVPDTLFSAGASGPPATGANAPLSDILAAIPFARLHVGSVQITGNVMTTDTVYMQDLSADLNSLQMTCRPSQCRMASALDLTINKLRYHNDLRPVELDLVTVGTNTPISITLDANTNTLSLDARALTMALPAIRVDDSLTGLIGDIQRLNISQTLSPAGFNPADLAAHAEVSVSEVYTNLVDINLWSMQLDQHLTWQRGTIHLVGALVQNDQRLLLNDLQHNLTQGTGQGTFEVPRIDFNDSTNELSDLLSPSPWQADVVAGSASASARLTWLTDNNQPIVTGSVQLSLDDISGYVNDIGFLRLTTDFAAELLPDWQLRSSRAASVSLASLDAGVEISDIRSNYRIDSGAGSVALTDASFNVFGGTVSSERLDYHQQDNDSRFTIVIDSIDLNQVLDIGAYQGVSATGLVSGQLPVRLRGLTPSISGGTLTALQPGGTIRYSRGDSSAGNPDSGDQRIDNQSTGNQSLDMVYQALEHYRFSLMETNVDYQESGELDLAIRMEGISPELNGGQRINLNLNINDDVPALLQSLQAARSVTDSIQARLDARQSDTSDNSP